MARSSEKKAATLRAEVIRFYQPFLLGCNGFYLVLRWYMMIGGSTNDILSFQSILRFVQPQSIFIVFVLFGLQYYSYLGILEDATNPKRRNKKESLAGGAHLDLLAFVLFIQFGSILVTTKLYYLLFIIPIWGIWYLYKTFYGTSK